MENVIAVIVSHNRLNLLESCIQSIRNQSRKPNAILVVNNGSLDYTGVWLDKQLDVIHFYQENEGSAGGFASGISWAYNNGYSWVWCMDDDSCPKEDALEMLLKYKGTEKALINLAVISKEDKISFVWKTKNLKTIQETNETILEKVSHPFTGTLIHHSIIEKVGLPMSNLFYWGAGLEYYYRIVNQHKIPAKTVLKSIHYHPDHIYQFTKEWDIQSSWKMYFYVRNRFQVLQTKYSSKPIAFILYMSFIIAFCGAAFVMQKKDKLRKTIFALWPMSDALSNNFSATADSVQTRLDFQYLDSFTKIIFYPFKKLLLSIFVPSFREMSNTSTI
jgi:GT2 family glycosyltransferase